MLSVRAGALNRRITFQENDGTRTTYGGVDNTWSDVATVWAAIWPSSGSEFYGADQQQASGVTRIRVRYRADITAAMRIKHNDTYYAIVAPPRNTETGYRMLDLICEQRSWDN